MWERWGLCLTRELGAVAAWALPSPASTGAAGELGLSPGTAHGGHPVTVTPSEVQGKEGAKGSAGGCDLPFLTCKSLGEKDWRWSLAVHSSQMSGLSGVFAQSSGCAALQHQAQEELLLFLEGRPKLFQQPPSIVTATVTTASLSHHREALPSVAPHLCWPRIFPRAGQSCHFGGGLLFPVLLIVTFMLPG